MVKSSVKHKKDTPTAKKKHRVQLKRSQLDSMMHAKTRSIFERTRSRRRAYLERIGATLMPEAEPRASQTVKLDASLDASGRISMSMRKRPPTDLPRRQGDHVSAYRLIQETVLSRIRGKSPEAALATMADLILSADNLSNSGREIDFAHYYHSLSESMQKRGYLPLPQLELRIRAIETSSAPKAQKIARRENLIASQRELYKEFAISLARAYITERNRKALTVFPIETETKPPRDEGNRVRFAIQELQKIHARMEDTHEKGGEYRLSAGEIDTIGQKMYELFWYSKTLARSRKMGVLHQLLANHIELTFSSYPQFHGEQQRAIMESFIKQVAQDGKIGDKSYNWGMSDKELQTCITEVGKLLPDYYRDYENFFNCAAARTTAMDMEVGHEGLGEMLGPTLREEDDASMEEDPNYVEDAEMEGPDDEYASEVERAEEPVEESPAEATAGMNLRMPGPKV